MKAMTIKQLRYFEALMTHRHFGQAANAVSISQPALSQQIKELELALGRALFERDLREVRPTSFGQHIAPKIREILRNCDELGDMARAHQGAWVGPLRLGIIPTIAPYFLPKILGKLSKGFPQIDLHIRETVTDNLITELCDGRLDAAILALPLSEPLLFEFPLFEEKFVLLRPRSAANDPIPDAKTLGSMRLLLLEEGHCFRDQALAFCATTHHARGKGLDASTLTTLVQMVSAGMGVTLLPEMALDVELSAANVAHDYFPEPQPSRHIGMIWRKSNPSHDQLTKIADTLKRIQPSRYLART